jgi:flagellar hook-associated protein 3 FlgL
VVAAGNPALGDAGRATLAGELRGRYQDLLGLANATDGQGNYLYSGYRGGIRPFSETAPGQVQYAGDQGQRIIQLSPSRFIEVSESGTDVFQRVRTGNGAFVVQADPANGGSARVGPGTVTDPAAWDAAANPGRFTLRFDVDSGVVPAVTTYDIVDAVSGNSLLTGAAASATGPYGRTYVPGASIALRSQGAEPAFDFGANVMVEGAPADGDAVSVTRSGTQDIFATINEAIEALETPVTGVQSSTRLANAITLAISNLDNGIGRVLDVQTSLGSRQREVESTRSTSADLADQYTAEVSRLRDVDFAKAISDLTLQQTLLQAAQQSFLRVQNLSLFELL